jgi:hypothetical protein
MSSVTPSLSASFCESEHPFASTASPLLDRFSRSRAVGYIIWIDVISNTVIVGCLFVNPEHPFASTASPAGPILPMVFPGRTLIDVPGQLSTSSGTQ